MVSHNSKLSVTIFFMKIFYQGGLGNQLFQYSFGRYLIKRGFDVEFSDVLLKTTIKNVTKRKFELKELDSVNSSKKMDLFRVGLQNKFFHRSSTVLIEKRPDEDIETLITTQTKYILGYFQTSRFISQIWDTEKQNLEKLIQKPKGLPQTYVSLHLRLTDYKNPENKKIFGALSPFYFERILNSPNVSTIKDVIVVTDSTHDAKNFFSNLSMKGRDIHFVSNTSLEDFSLLIHSNIAILSNSSFSWWAGYLGSKLFSTKIHVPTPWYVNNWTTLDDFYPHEWVLHERI